MVNKTKESLKVVGWTLFGCTLTIMYFGMFSAMALSNMDSEIRTYHKIDMDNETKDAIGYLAKISEHQVEKDNLYCDKLLLNQTIQFQQDMKSLERYYTNK